jgi:hypothetical protein
MVTVYNNSWHKADEEFVIAELGRAQGKDKKGRFYLPGCVTRSSSSSCSSIYACSCCILARTTCADGATAAYEHQHVCPHTV